MAMGQKSMKTDVQNFYLTTSTDFVDSSCLLLPALHDHCEVEYPKHIYPWFECDWCVRKRFLWILRPTCIYISRGTLVRRKYVKMAFSELPRSLPYAWRRTKEVTRTSSWQNRDEPIFPSDRCFFKLNVNTYLSFKGKWHVPIFSEMFCSSKRAVLWFQLL